MWQAIDAETLAITAGAGLLPVLAELSDRHGADVVVRQGRVGMLLGRSSRTVRRAITAGRELGLLQWEHRCEASSDGRWRGLPARYRFELPAEPDTERRAAAAAAGARTRAQRKADAAAAAPAARSSRPSSTGPTVELVDDDRPRDPVGPAGEALAARATAFAAAAAARDGP